MAEGAPPAGTANPRVNSADPAALKAAPMPRASNGHNSSQNPTNEVASQAASWASRIAAASAASTRSRRLYSEMARTTRRNAPWTIRSTHTVSQLLTERGTMSVPTALYHAVSTSNAPTTAAAERPMSGTTTKSPGVNDSCEHTGLWHPRPPLGRFRQVAARLLAACQARGCCGRHPPQCGQRLGDVPAHLRDEQPGQRRDAALCLDPLDHADTARGDRLEHVVEDDLAQQHRAFAHPAPAGFHRRDDEGAAQVAALLEPPGYARLERPIQPRDLLSDIPLRPACHVGPHRPHRGRPGLQRCLALQQVHAPPEELTRRSKLAGWGTPKQPFMRSGGSPATTPKNDGPPAQLPGNDGDAGGDRAGGRWKAQRRRARGKRTEDGAGRRTGGGRDRGGQAVHGEEPDDDHRVGLLALS